MDLRDAAGLVASKKLTKSDVESGDKSKVAYMYENFEKAKKLKKEQEVKKFRLFGMGRKKKTKKDISRKKKTNIPRAKIGPTGVLSIPAKNALKAALTVVAAGVGIAGAKKLANEIAGRNERSAINDAYIERLRKTVRAKMKSGALVVSSRELKDAAEYIEDRGVYSNLIYTLENKNKNLEDDQFTEEELISRRKVRVPLSRVQAASIRGRK